MMINFLNPFLRNFTADNCNFYAIMITLICILAIFYCIEISILFSYTNTLKNKEILNLTEQLRQSQKSISEHKHNLDVMRTAGHKINERLGALEFIVADNKPLLDVIKSAQNDYNLEIARDFHVDALPSTNMMGLDILLSYVSNEAKKKGIDFNVSIKCNLNDIINDFITVSQLETLIGDHVRNAILACCNTTEKRHCILVQIDDFNGHYEISFYDTGMTFEIKTLLELGSVYSTTRESIGGNGIGFMTTFKTLKSCNASLLIRERDNETVLSFTKQITVRFDGKNDYTIATYRPDQIRSANNSKHITIVDS